MHDVQFNHASFDLVMKIIDRADDLVPGLYGRTRMAAVMDIQAANGVNGNSPINLTRLLGFLDADFAHDVFGIFRHMDRETGTLRDHFEPRAATVLAGA